ncbi:MAG TPA: hypothetical protein VGN04_00785 [Herbaspirillum sp.]|jgi:hypothetical protein
MSSASFVSLPPSAPAPSPCLSPDDLKNLCRPLPIVTALAGDAVPLTIAPDKMRDAVMMRSELDDAGRDVLARIVNILCGRERGVRIVADRRAAFAGPDPRNVLELDPDTSDSDASFELNDVYYPQDASGAKSMSGTLVFHDDPGRLALRYELRAERLAGEGGLGVTDLVVHDRYGGQFQVIGDNRLQSSTLWMFDSDVPEEADLPRTYQIRTPKDVKRATLQFERLAAAECDKLYDRIFFGIPDSELSDRLFDVFDVQHRLSPARQDDLFKRVASAYRAPENESHKPVMRGFCPGQRDEAEAFRRMSPEQRQKFASLFGIADGTTASPPASIPTSIPTSAPGRPLP